MEAVVERGNMERALRRVMSNKGVPGADGLRSTVRGVMFAGYANPRTIFTDSVSVARSAEERSVIFFPKRLLSAAHS